MSKSNLIASLLQSGISAAQRGEFKEAKEIFLKIIDLNDNILSVYLNIINIVEGILKEKNYKKIQEILNHPQINDTQKAMGKFLLSINEKKK